MSFVLPLAHGVGSEREDLPIPEQGFFIGATLVLVLSFVGLAVLWPSPRLQEARERVLLVLPR
ncbi:MAG TPA: hypothetical protein VHF89_16940, partial [Solirubrobacteraceae bacterium]|nr:hypothetical protein [Solirubrobacteraceae bacterium]